MVASANGKYPESEHVPSAITAPAVLQMRTLSIASTSFSLNVGAVSGAPVWRAGSGGHRLSALVPRTGANGGAHHLIQGEDLRVVRTTHEIEPLVLGRKVAVDVYLR